MLLSLSLALGAEPLDSSVVTMMGTANAYYTGADPVQDAGVPARLQTATFLARLEVVQTLLQDASCEVDGDRTISGAYKVDLTDGTTGEDELGALVVASVRKSRRAVSGMLGDETLGDPVGLWDDQLRFVVGTGEDFFVGQAARVRGARGVFMGLRASCPAGTSPEAALAAWFDGDLDGLDLPAAASIAGTWNTTGSCSIGVQSQPPPPELSISDLTTADLGAGPVEGHMVSGFGVTHFLIPVGTGGAYDVIGFYGGMLTRGSAVWSGDSLQLEFRDDTFGFTGCSLSGTRAP